jgi:cell division protein FtsB
MAQLKKKIFNKLFLKQSVKALIGLALLVLILWPLYGSIRKKYLINSEIEKLKKEINIYQTKNNHLDNLIKYLESDQYIEEQGRKNLGLAKEGEKIIVLKKSESNEAPKEELNGYEPSLIYDIGGTKNEENKKITNPIKWISYFLKHN